jgi:phosphatidylethanolamine-binding protein (PEBP) family uncharacterized protein
MPISATPRLLALAAVAVLISTLGASAFSARFSWLGIKGCGKISPAFTIYDAPKGTGRLRFMMSDKDATPGFQHGGSAVPYDGGGLVPQGAIDYLGPCPPFGAIHRYVWTVEALDNNGEILATTAAEAPFERTGISRRHAVAVLFGCLIVGAALWFLWRSVRRKSATI